VLAGWVIAPGPGRPATPSTDGVPVAAMQKVAAEIRFGVPGTPARLIWPFTKHCWFAKVHVSPGSQKVQNGVWQSASALHVLKVDVEHVPTAGPAVQIPSSDESLSPPFTRQSPGWQKPFGGSQSVSSVHGWASKAPPTHAASHAVGRDASPRPPTTGQ
jgi:hypothetical protein